MAGYVTVLNKTKKWGTIDSNILKRREKCYVSTFWKTNLILFNICKAFRNKHGNFEEKLLIFLQALIRFISWLDFLGQSIPGLFLNRGGPKKTLLLHFFLSAFGLGISPQIAFNTLIQRNAICDNISRSTARSSLVFIDDYIENQATNICTSSRFWLIQM